MGFIKKDNLYQITLITDNRDIILGIFFGNKHRTENNIEVIEWNFTNTDSSNIRTSKVEVLNQILSGLNSIEPTGILRFWAVVLVVVSATLSPTQTVATPSVEKDVIIKNKNETAAANRKRTWKKSWLGPAPTLVLESPRIAESEKPKKFFSLCVRDEPFLTFTTGKSVKEIEIDINWQRLRKKDPLELDKLISLNYFDTKAVKKIKNLEPEKIAEMSDLRFHKFLVEVDRQNIERLIFWRLGFPEAEYYPEYKTPRSMIKYEQQ